MYYTLLNSVEVGRIYFYRDKNKSKKVLFSIVFFERKTDLASKLLLVILNLPRSFFAFLLTWIFKIKYDKLI